MGVPGRRPTPVEAQIAAGDPSKKGKHKLQEIADRQPQAPGQLPACPEHLDGLARQAWEDWSECLAEMKISKRPDAIMLEGACVAYGRAVEADERLKREGLVVGELDSPKPHPCCGISQKCWAQVRAFCSEFGLSPSSRTRLALEAIKDDGPSLMDMLNAADEREVQ
jgi:P27 family predicted phage terminase small subunit